MTKDTKAAKAEVDPETKTAADLLRSKLRPGESEFWIADCNCGQRGCPEACAGVEFVMRNPMVVPLGSVEATEKVSVVRFPKDRMANLITKLMDLMGSRRREAWAQTILRERLLLESSESEQERVQ